MSSSFLRTAQLEEQHSFFKTFCLLQKKSKKKKIQQHLFAEKMEVLK